jgi:hypothetical protein
VSDRGWVKEIYSERAFCTTAGHDCAARMAGFPGAGLSWSFESRSGAKATIRAVVHGW